MTISTLPKSMGLSFCGLSFNSPIVLTSGSIGFGDEYTRIEGFNYEDVGAVFLNGTTLHARSGYSSHRLHESPMGLLSATGWPNPGVDTVVNTILTKLNFGQTQVCANVCGEDIKDFIEVTRRFNDSSVVAIELNLPASDFDSQNSTSAAIDRAAQIVAACRAVTDKPLISKLSADVGDIALLARYCIDAGTNAVSLISSVAGMAINIESRRPVLGHSVGGLSGPAIKPIAILKVMQVADVARPHGIGIIGQGGVRSAEDAIEFLIAGADVVGVCTGLYYDPLVCSKINFGINEYLQRHGLSSVTQLSGSLQKR
jgi:dihydroorotate dehydrogenase (NAD+) catalytic subunit